MKLLLIIVLLVGAAFGIPAIRNRIAGPLDPVLSKLGPAGEKIKTPFQRWAAKNEATAIVQRLSEDNIQRKPLPTPRSFQDWVRQNIRSETDATTDPWGHPYYFVLTRQQMTVGSIGKDGQRNTPDDILATMPLQ